MAEFSSWHVAVAAEAIAAAQFARLGYDVSVQYGANQPGYDLVVVKGENVLKVSVKGSQSGSWGLTQSYKKGRTYHEAIDEWLKKHKPRTVYCLVQFHKSAIDQMPRLYLATPKQVAKRLKETARGRGETILYEERRWGSNAFGAGTVDSIPDSWRFSAERIEQLLRRV